MYRTGAHEMDGFKWLKRLTKRVTLTRRAFTMVLQSTRTETNQNKVFAYTYT